MRLFEAIIDANHRALAGDSLAGVHPGDFAGCLPLVALTCIDPRLNRLFPGALGIPEDQFIWLRNAGNIITSPLSSTMRSLALACAVKRGREIVVIGHDDCRVRQTPVSDLIAKFKEQGIERAALPDNLAEFFGVFASERQNVIRAVDHIRSSPLIGPLIPVHGLMIDTNSGRLDWVVNGYEAAALSAAKGPVIQMPSIGRPVEESADWGPIKLGEIKFPETKIGELSTATGQTSGAPLETAPAPRKSVRPVAVPVAPKPAPPAPRESQAPPPFIFQPPPPPLTPPPPPPKSPSRPGKWGLRD
jgi:carbonic anhydrase